MPTKKRRSLVVTSIIFSRNRPAQLDLTLKTIAKNFDQCTNIIVVYNIDSEYVDAYKALKQEHSNVDWRRQTGNFYKDVFHCCSALDCQNDFVCLLTDDCIVYNQVPDLSRPLSILQKQQTVSCISLRLGMNINSRQIDNQIINDSPKLPIYEDDTKTWIIFNHFQNCYGSYWCYPVSVDGTIYTRGRLKKMLQELVVLNNHYSGWHQNPNDLEAHLQRFIAVDSGHSTIAPFVSCVFNSPNNRVQTSHGNRSGDWYDQSAEFLLNKFNQGKRIKFEKLEIPKISCPHTEINLREGLQ